MTGAGASFEATYDAYLAAASEPDPAERLRRLRECATEDLEIVSPFPYRVRGVEEAARTLGDVAAAGPGGRLLLGRSSPVDGHHDIFRATFENRSADGALLSTGLHVAELRDGLLARLIVFVPDHVETA